MILKWEPKGVFGDDDGNDFSDVFEGYVELEIKPKSERLRIAQENNTSINKDGEIDVVESNMAKIESADKLVRSCVKTVALKAGDTEINSLDELECFAEGVALSGRLLEFCIGGIPLGKPLSKKSKKRASS